MPARSNKCKDCLYSERAFDEFCVGCFRNNTLVDNYMRKSTATVRVPKSVISDVPQKVFKLPTAKSPSVKESAVEDEVLVTGEEPFPATISVTPYELVSADSEVQVKEKKGRKKKEDVHCCGECQDFVSCSKSPGSIVNAKSEACIDGFVPTAKA